MASPTFVRPSIGASWTFETPPPVAQPNGPTRLINMADNQLNGSVPDAISALTGLTRLDLHLNRLNGRLPEGLSRLTGLM